MAWTPPPRLTPKEMRQFTNDWAEVFPEMTVLRPGWLISIVAPLAVGILLEKSRSDFYKPQIYLYSLINSATGIGSVRIDSCKRFLGIDRSKHVSTYKQKAEEMREQMFLPLRGDVSFDSVKDAYAQITDWYGPGRIETPALLAGWLGLYDQVNPCIETARECCVKRETVWWFEEFGGGYENFMNNLREAAFDKKRLLETYNLSITKEKLQNVPKRYVVP
jgi:hypothetical protein